MVHCPLPVTNTCHLNIKANNSCPGCGLHARFNIIIKHQLPKLWLCVCVFFISLIIFNNLTAAITQVMGKLALGP